jgi:hypothetical protein
MHFAAATKTTRSANCIEAGSLKRKGPEGFMRKARKQERTLGIVLLHGQAHAGMDLVVENKV